MLNKILVTIGVLFLVFDYNKETNEQVKRYNLAKAQEEQEAVKTMGEIAQNVERIYTFNARQELEKVNSSLAKTKADLKAKGKSEQEIAENAEVVKLSDNLTALQKDFDRQYGTGSDFKRGITAITAGLQGLASNNIAQAAVGLASPYLNEKVKEATTEENGEVNKPANLLTHTVLGAVEAKVTGNNALAGAVAGATGEVTAMLLTQGKSPQDLTESEKQNVVALSQIASGLAGAVVGDSAQTAVAGAEIGKRAVENNYLLVDYSQLKGLTKTDTERGQKINEKLEKAGVENIDNYANQYRACGVDESCQKQVIDAEMKAISRTYDIVNELAKSGELSKSDIDFIQSTLVPRARSAYSSKVKDETTREVYRSGDLETFAKYEQGLANARFNAQLKEWVDRGLTDEQIKQKLENEPLAIALSTAGPNVGGRQPAGGNITPIFANGKQTLLQIRKLNERARDFSVEVPSSISAKDRQVGIQEIKDYKLSEVQFKGVVLNDFKGANTESLKRFNQFLSNAVDTTTGKGIRNATKPPEISIESDWFILTKGAQIREYPNGRRVATFSTGEQAVFRPSKTGPMTIELQRPDAKKIIEVRYVQ